MKKILMTSLSVYSLGVSCNEMSDTPMLLAVVTLCNVRVFGTVNRGYLGFTYLI